jgi:hypothetical protein
MARALKQLPSAGTIVSLDRWPVTMREVAFAHTPDLDRAPKQPVAGKALAAGTTLTRRCRVSITFGGGVATSREGHRLPRSGRDSANAITVPKCLSENILNPLNLL